VNQETVSRATAQKTSPSRRQPAGLPARPQIRLDGPETADRQVLESCIAEKFARQYSARIEQFLPFLLSLKTSGQLGAVVGLRPAARGRLFLEQYLDRPVEQSVAGAFMTPVDRTQVVEIGNLAAVEPGTASMLFGILATVLDVAGIPWVVCTATPQVRAMLDKLRFPAIEICTADPRVLGQQLRDWGTYYASQPTVIVGDARLAAANAARNPQFRRLTDALAPVIQKVAAELRATV
jgi:hypothetical protein